MGSTTRFTLPWPELTDAPNGPVAFQNLATATEGWLARAIPCTSGTRPASPPTGMAILESDTGAYLLWNGTAWIAPPAASSATTTAEARYGASSAQTIPSSTLTPVAFGTAEVTSANVTRTVTGSGHKFALALTGRWGVDLSVRFAANAAVGERYAGLYLASATSIPLIGNGGSGPSAVTCQAMTERRFTAGQELLVQAWQDTGNGRALEPATSGLGNVRCNLTYLGA